MPRSTRTTRREAAAPVDAPGLSGASGPVTPSRAGASGPPVTPTPAGSPAKKTTGGGRARTKAAAPGPSFEDRQLEALLAERSTYVHQAEELAAQATSLAQEHEPGDVQFDEEGGEGGTANVDRELDLALSAQARRAVEEIDRALAKLDAGIYGLCDQCHQPIPEARLEALPHAALCVACKAGGLASLR
jgi:DnaK suppressor protein